MVFDAMLAVIGFMFLVNSNVSFSIVLFYFLAVMQEGVTNRIGYDITRPDAFVWGMQSRYLAGMGDSLRW